MIMGISFLTLLVGGIYSFVSLIMVGLLVLSSKDIDKKSGSPVWMEVLLAFFFWWAILAIAIGVKYGRAVDECIEAQIAAQRTKEKPPID